MASKTQLVSEVDDILRHVACLQIAAFDAYSPLEGRSFIPKTAVRNYLTRNKIRTLLAYCGLPSYEWETIHSHYMTVFIVLISIGKGKYIAHFRGHDFLADEHLPYYDAGSWPPACLKFFDRFYDSQWKFCAQDFPVNRLDDRIYHWKRIMPMTSKQILKRSADSTTYKIEIHSDYAPTATVSLLSSRIWPTFAKHFATDTPRSSWRYICKYIRSQVLSF
jgi:hypothetical protein